MEAAHRPKLRLLDSQRVQTEDHDGVVLSDPEGLFEGQIFVPRGMLPVLMEFTGEHDCATIASRLTTTFGQAVEPADVERIAADLDERLCLEGPRVTKALAEQRVAWDALEERPATHAGSSGYPADPPACASRLREIVGTREPQARPLAGLVAPHIDLERGVGGYSAAYGRLIAAAPSDLYVIFGTCHRCPTNEVVPTEKHFATPIGTVETDTDFVREVAARAGGGDEELLHIAEHSIEFQALFLRHCLGDRPFRIAPFLTGRIDAEPGGSQRTEAIIDAVLDAVRTREGERVCFVAGADLAHLGPFFGDAEPVSDGLLEDLGARDRASLDLLVKHDAEAFFRDVEGDGNSRRICGTVPMYLVARLVAAVAPDCCVELLDYGQAVAPDRSQVVTYAALAYA